MVRSKYNIFLSFIIICYFNHDQYGNTKTENGDFIRETFLGYYTLTSNTQNATLSLYKSGYEIISYEISSTGNTSVSILGWSLDKNNQIVAILKGTTGNSGTLVAHTTYVKNRK